MMIIFLIAAALLAGLFLFFRFKKSGDSLPAKTVSEEYTQLLETHVKYYRNLQPEQKEVFAKRVGEFMKRVTIEGVGTTVELSDRILVASSALIPVFGLGDWKYPNLTNVILYPDTFNEKFQFEGHGRTTLGMVGTGYMNGQMILSKSALVADFAHTNSKSNTAIHEFVHLLDKTDGSTDGIPENLMDRSSLIPWQTLMQQEIEKINNGESDINPYALSGDAEFFAVVSEYFFQQPGLLASNHPEVYGMLKEFFKVDLG
jgi:MtfA peptidase